MCKINYLLLMSYLLSRGTGIHFLSAKSIFIIFWISITGCGMVSCGRADDSQLEQALERAGDNRAELEQVLKHYAGEPEKLEAASFLIRNMMYHFSIEDYFVHTGTGEHYYPDITHFADQEDVSRHCDSLRASGWSIRQEKQWDLNTVRADFLIRNIDLAFEVKKKPWAKEVTWADFCRYVLPYRVQNEPLTSLREKLMRKYVPLLDSARVQHPLDACRLLNDCLHGEITYRETGNPLRPTIEETYRAGIGTCEALCNYVTLVMRAAGIPVAVRRTTWTRMARGHVWCAVRQDGKSCDFGPGEMPFGAYRHRLATVRYLQPAKMYQLHFDADLSGFPVDDDGYVTVLKNPLFSDVTDEGELPVYDLHIPVSHKEASSGRLAYLCAYNAGKWLPVAMGRCEGDTCRFTNVAGRNFFLLAVAEGKHRLRYVGAPFLTRGDGTYHRLLEDAGQPVCQIFRRETGGSPYSLYYWDSGAGTFRFLPYRSLTDSTQEYDNIPRNALLWYVHEKTVQDDRIGMIVEGTFKKSNEF